MSKYTPGPWIYDGATVYALVDVPGQYYKGQQYRANRMYAHVYHQTVAGGTEPEAIANARLIAVAPDLLEACKDVVDECEASGSPSLGLLERLKVIISKAEGA